MGHGFLVIFFPPSASKSGGCRTFGDIIITMGLLGLVPLIVGYKVRGRARAQ